MMGPRSCKCVDSEIERLYGSCHTQGKRRRGPDPDLRDGSSPIWARRGRDASHSPLVRHGRRRASHPQPPPSCRPPLVLRGARVGANRAAQRLMPAQEVADRGILKWASRTSTLPSLPGQDLSWSVRRPRTRAPHRHDSGIEMQSSGAESRQSACASRAAFQTLLPRQVHMERCMRRSATPVLNDGPEGRVIRCIPPGQRARSPD